MRRFAMILFFLIASTLSPLHGQPAGADQETAEVQTAEPTDRFDIITYNFLRDDKEAELWIKMDRFTGQAWTLDGAVDLHWKKIPEQKESEKPVAGDVLRYDLYVHDFTKDGKDMQVHLRFDRQTGKSWRWSYTEPTWVVVGEDK